MLFPKSKGIHRKGNDDLYVARERRFTSYMTIITRATFVLSSSGAAPFPLAAYFWCIGKYTVNSWVFHLKLWLVMDSTSQTLDFIRSVACYRTPFELNTTYRCIAMALFQMGPIFYAPLIYCAILSLFAGVVMYASAILIDIKSIFARIDRLLNSREAVNEEMTVLMHCKEAIDLHAQLYRQAFDLHASPRDFPINT